MRGTAAGLFLAALAASCGSTDGSRQTEEVPLVQGAAISIPISAELREIAQLAYERSLSGGRLIELLGHDEPLVRYRAAEALGRFPYPAFGREVTEALVRAMEDPDPAVRRQVAFALGQRGDPIAGGVLAVYRNDPDPGLRARVAEASRRLDDPGLRGEVLLALQDENLEVREAAVLAMGLWEPEGPDAADADAALLEVLRPTGGPGPGREVQPELRWRALYALQRRGSERGRPAFLEYVDSGVTLERIFAVRGLARIPPDAASIAALSLATEDGDWRVACEAAIGLGRTGVAEAVPALLGAAEHPSPHVRRSAFEAIGAFRELDALGPHRSDAVSKLTRGTHDVSSTARAAAIVALAKILRPKDGARTVERFLQDPDPVVRAGAAEAAAELETTNAFPLLRRLVGDENPRVAVTAAGGLGRHATPETRALLHQLLRDPDNGMRLAAVIALQEMPHASDVAPLAGAMEATGDIAPEIAFNALKNLGAIGGDDALRLVERALSHTEPYVRRVAQRVLLEDFELNHKPVEVPASSPARAPLPGESYPRYRRNPVVEMRTTRGTMVFELFPLEAPVHVHNFLELVRTDHYDGLIFHRVVPDFVIQGGDYRGDGNGGRPWNGTALPQEFTPRRYVRGTLGMPRNENPDSGGSQFFVTHRPTPHLDGRYTIFGQLRAGGDVLDAVQVGDRILDVAVQQ